MGQLAVLAADQSFDQSSLPLAASTAKMPRLVPVTMIVLALEGHWYARAVLRPGVEALLCPDGLAVGLVEGDDAALAARLEDGHVLVDQYRLGVPPSARCAAELLGFVAPFFLPVLGVIAADQAVAAEQIELSIVDHR